MGAFLSWDRDDHFAVDHGISGISRKTIRFYDGETDIGFAAYPAAGLGSLMVQTRAHDTPGFREACGEMCSRFEAALGSTGCAELRPQYFREGTRCLTVLETAADCFAAAADADQK